MSISKIRIGNVEHELETTISNVSGLQDALNAKAEVSDIPTKVSELTNDAGYLTKHQSLDGLATENYVDDKIAAIPTPDVSGQINTHNTNTSAHNDIRDLISGLTTRLNTLADSDDTTLDQMSEVVAYIKSNKSLIDSITTSKVNVSDIINNLTTNVSNKPLSSAQGVALKALIDALQTEVNSKADSSSLTSHTGNTTVHVTSAERTNWNAAKTHADSAHAPSNAEKNQNAFSNVAVGDTTIAADSVTDTLTIVAGENVTIAPDATNGTVTIAANIETDSTPTSGSSNPVTSGGVYTALSNKQDKLTFDSTPTSGSSNPVTSGGVYTEVDSTKMIANMAMPGSLKWDGVVGDREYITVYEESGDGITVRQVFAHVSDYVPEILSILIGDTPEEDRVLQVLCSFGGIEFGGVHETQKMEVQVSDDMLIMGEGFLFIPTDGYTMDGITFSKKGWYFMSYSYDISGVELPLMYVSGLCVPNINFPDVGGSDKYFEDVVETDFVGDTLTWDGIVGDRTVVSTERGTIKSSMVHMSDDTPSIETLNSAGATATKLVNGESSAVELQFIMSEDGKPFAFAESGAVTIVYSGGVDVGGIIIPKAGVYFLSQTNGTNFFYISSLTVPGYNFTTATTQTVIKTEHLPEALRFGEITTEVHGNTLTWDGNTEWLANIENALFKVSDAVPALDDIHRGFSFTVSDNNGNEVATVPIPVETASEITMNDIGIISYSNYVYVLTQSITESDVTYPIGVYLYRDENNYISSLTINGYDGFVSTETKVVKIDPKYLPNGIDGGISSSEVDAKIQSAIGAAIAASY